MAPSVDAVGRYFPLAVASALPSASLDVVGTLPGQAPARELLDLAERLAEPSAAWLAEESEMFGRCLLLCEALPPAEQYSAMMDGRWVEHGWGRRDVRSGAAA